MKWHISWLCIFSLGISSVEVWLEAVPDFFSKGEATTGSEIQQQESENLLLQRFLWTKLQESKWICVNLSLLHTGSCTWLQISDPATSKNSLNKAKKYKLCVSKLLRAFVFWCAFDSAKFKLLIFFLLSYFFSSFLWTCLSKYTWKDTTDTIKHFVQQTSSTLCSVLYLVHP